VTAITLGGEVLPEAAGSATHGSGLVYNPAIHKHTAGSLVSRRFRLLVPVLLLALMAAAQQDRHEQRAARHLEAVRHQPLLLHAFLYDMPKGGDLHNHLVGAVYAESFIQYAADDDLCVDRQTMALGQPPCDAKTRPPAHAALNDPVLHRQMVDAFSMRDFQPGAESGHDHFFDSFGKFGPVVPHHMGDFLAEVASRAAAQNEQYLELMVEVLWPVIHLSQNLTWSGDFDRAREALLAAGLNDGVAAASRSLDQAESQMRSRLHCGAPAADAGCRITIRYISTVLRAFPPAQVFAQALGGFELASRDPRVVSVNLVLPEHDYVPRHDFSLHMKMFSYMHELYPKVHLTLHAGELTPGLVPPEDLRFHIRDSIEIGHAERIGHGVDVMYESDPMGLLREMAQRKVMVETCLSSNDAILGVRGARHPLPLYMKHGVPVALATDDEGISRSDMTREYQRAVEDFGLSYTKLKTMARTSLEHAFLPGGSVWAQTAPFKLTAACAGDTPGAPQTSPACRNLLQSSERARVQWELEAELARFEKTF
jgi:adenosine deaminase